MFRTFMNTLVNPFSMIKDERKVTYAGSSFQISIPKWWCKHHQLKVGDILNVELDCEKTRFILEIKDNGNTESTDNKKPTS